jgi:hypothetical protein
MQAAMDKLVDTAVGLVEEGRLQQAVEVLQQGITLLTSTYPGRCADSRSWYSLGVVNHKAGIAYAVSCLQIRTPADATAAACEPFAAAAAAAAAAAVVPPFLTTAW